MRSEIVEFEFLITKSLRNMNEARQEWINDAYCIIRNEFGMKRIHVMGQGIDNSVLSIWQEGNRDVRLCYEHVPVLLDAIQKIVNREAPKYSEKSTN